MNRLLLLITANLLVISQSLIAQETITINDLVVTVIDEIDVPARQTGVLESLTVAEGDRVTAGQTIGKLDARQVQLQAKLAQADLQIARKRTDSHFESRLANQDLELARELAQQQTIAGEIARKKADNDVRIRAASKSTSLAKNEWSRANDARARFADSVSKSEIDSLRLAYERSQLEAQQASFDQRIDALAAKSAEQETLLHRLRVRRAEVTVQQADSDKQILEIQTTAKQYAAQLAELAAQQHSIVAPIAGVVVQRYQRAGQWVEPGTAIVRVVRMDRLQAEGFLDVTTAMKLRDHKKVTLRSERIEDETIAGSVTFVSPEVNPVNGQVRVLIQFDNPDEQILPGMRVDITATTTHASSPGVGRQ